MQGNFPAMKIGYRQQKDGVAVTFLIPHDAVQPAFAAAPFGTRLVVAYAQYTEEETAPALPAPDAPSPAAPPPDASEQPKRRWRDVPASEQAGMWCNDKAAFGWRSAYTDADNAWLPCVQPPSRRMSGDAASNRLWLCAKLRITSLRDLDTDREAHTAWLRLDEQFRRETGREAEPR